MYDNAEPIMYEGATATVAQGAKAAIGGGSPTLAGSGNSRSYTATPVAEAPDTTDNTQEREDVDIEIDKPGVVVKANRSYKWLLLAICAGLLLYYSKIL